MKKRGRPRKHKNITVRQKDDYNKYHSQYNKMQRKKKKDPLPMGELFTKRDERAFDL